RRVCQIGDMYKNLPGLRSATMRFPQRADHCDMATELNAVWFLPPAPRLWITTFQTWAPAESELRTAPRSAAFPLSHTCSARRMVRNVAVCGDRNVERAALTSRAFTASMSRRHCRRQSTLFQ